MLVRAGNELYIVCGSYGRGGTGSAGYQTTSAGGRVTVPSNCWTVVVVVVVPTGSNDVGRATSSTRVIVVNTPNKNSLSSAWGGYRTTVDAIEAAAGLAFNAANERAEYVGGVYGYGADVAYTKAIVGQVRILLSF